MKNITAISGGIVLAFMALMPVAANAQYYYGGYSPSYMQSPSYSYMGPSPVYVMPQSNYNTYSYGQQSYGYAQPSSYGSGYGYSQPSYNYYQQPQQPAYNNTYNAVANEQYLESQGYPYGAPGVSTTSINCPVGSQTYGFDPPYNCMGYAYISNGGQRYY